MLLPATLVAIALLAAAGGLSAQGRGELELPRLPSPVRIDGAVTDSAWAGIQSLRSPYRHSMACRPNAPRYG
jgi:hypothetical protein